MNLLLDTHAFLWFINNDNRISTTAQEAIALPTNDVYLSIASIWEIAIKVSIGKLTLMTSFDTFIPQQIATNKINILDITVPHLATITRLPFHHRDPFDRLIIAQGLTEQMTIVGVDTIFDSYGVVRLW
jgi:PIN domain nuclease of toxin-antitoxin system